MRTSLLIVLLWLSPIVTHAAEFEYRVDPLPKELQRASFRLYLPDTLDAKQPVRAVLGNSKYGSSAGLYTSQEWRAFAAEHHCAQLDYDLVSSEKKQANLAKDQQAVDLIVQALDHFAKQTGRPELRHSGIVFAGASQAGWQALAFANRLPDRTIAVVLHHGAPITVAPEEGMKKESWPIPLLFLMGGTDDIVQPWRLQPWVMKSRARGALWATALQPGVAHGPPGNQDFPMLWLDAILARRLPKMIPVDKPCPLQALDESTGWLADVTLSEARDKPTTAEKTAIAPYKDYKGDRLQAMWLPNEAVARAWEHYCKSGTIRRD